MPILQCAVNVTMYLLGMFPNCYYKEVKDIIFYDCVTVFYSIFVYMLLVAAVWLMCLPTLTFFISVTIKKFIKILKMWQKLCSSPSISSDLKALYKCVIIKFIIIIIFLLLLIIIIINYYLLIIIYLLLFIYYYNNLFIIYLLCIIIIVTGITVLWEHWLAEVKLVNMDKWPLKWLCYMCISVCVIVNIGRHLQPLLLHLSLQTLISSMFWIFHNSMCLKIVVNAFIILCHLYCKAVRSTVMFIICTVAHFWFKCTWF